MTLVMYVVVTALVTTVLFLGIRYFVRAYVRYRDSRIITCRIDLCIGPARHPAAKLRPLAAPTKLRARMPGPA